MNFLLEHLGYDGVKWTQGEDQNDIYVRIKGLSLECMNHDTDWLFHLPIAIINGLQLCTLPLCP